MIHWLWESNCSKLEPKLAYIREYPRAHNAAFDFGLVIHYFSTHAFKLQWILKCYHTTFLLSDTNVKIAFIITSTTPTEAITEIFKPIVIQLKTRFYCSLHLLSLTATVLVSSDSFYGVLERNLWNYKSLRILAPERASRLQGSKLTCKILRLLTEKPQLRKW